MAQEYWTDRMRDLPYCSFISNLIRSHEVYGSLNLLTTHHEENGLDSRVVTKIQYYKVEKKNRYYDDRNGRWYYDHVCVPNQTFSSCVLRSIKITLGKKLHWTKRMWLWRMLRMTQVMVPPAHVAGLDDVIEELRILDLYVNQRFDLMMLGLTRCRLILVVLEQNMFNISTLCFDDNKVLKLNWIY